MEGVERGDTRDCVNEGNQWYRLNSVESKYNMIGWITPRGQSTLTVTLLVAGVCKSLPAL